MNLRYLFPSAFLAGVATCASGVLAGESRTVTLEDCVQMALQKNLQIRIERLEPELARASLSGSYAYYEPVLGASVTHSSRTQPGGFDEQNRPFGQADTSANQFSLGLRGFLPTGMDYSFGAGFGDSFGSREIALGALQRFENASGGLRFSFSQPLLKNFWIDQPRLNIRLSKKNLEASEHRLRNVMLSTITSVETTYYELIASRDAIDVAQMALQLAEQLLRENKKRVEVGVLAPLDEKEAESQVAASRASLLGSQNAFVIQQNRLKSLVDDSFARWQNVDLAPAEALKAEPTTFSLQDSWSKGIALRPDLQQAKINLERRNITLKYQQNQLFPQLDLQGAYGRNGSGAELSDALHLASRGDYPEYSFGATLSIPLAGNRQARTALRISRAEIEQDMLALKALEQQILVEIDDAITRARTSYQQVKATEEAVAFAEEALSAEQKKLENGKSTSFQVLQLQRTLTQRRFDNIRARVDYNVALARLAQSEGSILERHRINVEVH